MILQVLSDSGERHANGNIVLGQLLRRPYAGQHQQLRRVDRTRGQDHFARGARRESLAVANVVHADGTASLHDDTRDLRLHFDRQTIAR